MLEKNAKKGRLIHVQGKLQTRRWRKPGEDFERFSTEIIVVPGHRVQFYDKPKGNGATDAQAPMDDTAAQTATAADAGGDPTDTNDIPF